MSGSVRGGKLAAQTSKAKYGKDFFERIGRIGGQNGTTGGFYVNRELAREAGRIGGSVSRLPKDYKVSDETKAKLRAAHQARKLREEIFIPDSEDFGEGFNRPSKMRQLIDRMLK